MFVPAETVLMGELDTSSNWAVKDLKELTSVLGMFLESVKATVNDLNS